MPFLRAILLTLLTAAVASAAVEVQQKPIKVVRRTFDPKNPPKEMPPLTPPEAALCQGESSIETRVAGRTSKTDGDGFASLNVTDIRIELRLTVTLWLPKGADKRLVDHEETHRLIHEHYYKTAAKVARDIAAPYLEENAEIHGRDTDKAAGEVLDRIAGEIMAKYKAAVPVEKAQRRFDDLTDHGRRDLPNDRAMKQAIEEAK